MLVALRDALCSMAEIRVTSWSGSHNVCGMMFDFSILVELHVFFFDEHGQTVSMRSKQAFKSGPM